MELVLGTRNSGKISELKELCRPLGIQVCSLEHLSKAIHVEEIGVSFLENATLKAVLQAKALGRFVLAEDSGLVVDSLNGEPGIYSARWAGEDASDEDKVDLTLEKMKDIDECNRGAYFESDVALVSPSGEEHVFVGRVEGKIASKPIGINRPKLPYDLIFVPEKHSRTFAQMSDEEKNSMSHRGRAFQKLKAFLIKRK